MWMESQWIIIIIIAVVLAVLLWYFRPMKMADLINENQKIIIMRTESGIQNGEPNMD